MRRRLAIAALPALGFASLGAVAQPLGRPHRIGFLGLSSAADYAPFLNAFVDALRELGYEVGRNIVIEYRWAEGREDRLTDLAQQLVRLDPDVIVSHATGVRAAQSATATIPIVMGVSADPVGMGLIKSLARPGGNTTGVASQMIDLSAKRLELLKEIAPKIRQVAVLSRRSIPAAQRGLAEIEAAAGKLGVRVQPRWLDDDPAALDPLLAAILRDRPDGLLLQPHPMARAQLVRITGFAASNGLPSMGGARQFVDDGGLAAYGGDFTEGWRVAARYVDRILKGAKPGDLPVEQPIRFEFALNLKTAQLLRIALAPALLLRADVVIR